MVRRFYGSCGNMYGRSVMVNRGILARRPLLMLRCVVDPVE